MGSMEINITNIHSVLICANTRDSANAVSESLFQEELLKFASSPQKKPGKKRKGDWR